MRPHLKLVRPDAPPPEKPPYTQALLRSKLVTGKPKSQPLSCKVASIGATLETSATGRTSSP
jgi:hypothetical protein